MSIFRCTTYEIQADEFTGSTYTLSLNNDLESNYFAFIDPIGAADTNDTPDDGLSRVTGDPHSNFSTVTAADELLITRDNSSLDWQGSITVVECQSSEDTDGFTLVEVLEVTGTGTDTSGSLSHATAVVAQTSYILGGYLSSVRHVDQFNRAAFRLQRSGEKFSGQLNWSRLFGGTSTAGDGECTVYVIEWGSSWTIAEHNFEIDPCSGGSGFNAASEIDSDSLSASVNAEQTWICGSLIKDSSGMANGPFGTGFGLGDGQSVATGTETEVYFGCYIGGSSLKATLYLHSHSDLEVTHYIGTPSADTDWGFDNSTATTTTTIADDGGGTGETYDNSSASVQYTEGERFIYQTHGCSGSGRTYFRPFSSARPTASTTAKTRRRFTGQESKHCPQLIDFNQIVFVDDLSSSSASSKSSSSASSESSSNSTSSSLSSVSSQSSSLSSSVSSASSNSSSSSLSSSVSSPSSSLSSSSVSSLSSSVSSSSLSTLSSSLSSSSSSPSSVSSSLSSSSLSSISSSSSSVSSSSVSSSSVSSSSVSSSSSSLSSLSSTSSDSSPSSLSSLSSNSSSVSSESSLSTVSSISSSSNSSFSSSLSSDSSSSQSGTSQSSSSQTNSCSSSSSLFGIIPGSAKAYFLSSYDGKATTGREAI